MTPVSLTAPKWAVSGRTHGEVLTAGVSTPGLEIVLLGVPEGFTPIEVEGWLRDLAGVAGETSRGDERERAIPALLHHALTGLLFSQSELWGRAAASPCSAAFVEMRDGCAFGWVGTADVSLLVDGIPYEPRWVIVRDDNGNEARAVVFPAGRHVLASLDWWPGGADGSEAPASIEAVYAPSGEPEQSYAPALEPELEAEQAQELAALDSSAIATSELPATSLPEVATELPAHLVSTDQPGLAPEAEVAAGAVAESAPAVAPDMPIVEDSGRVEAIVAEPSSGEPVAPPSPEPLAAVEEIAAAPAMTSPTESVTPSSPAEPSAATEPTPPAAPQGAHPVGRWLARMLGFGRADTPPAPVRASAAESEATPLSTYDSLLSESAAASEPVAEQTDLALPEPVVERTAATDEPATFAPVLEHIASPDEAAAFAPSAEYDETFALPDEAVSAVLAQSAEPPSPDAEAPTQAPIAEAPAPGASIAPPAFAAAGLADVLGAAFANSAPEPVVERAFTHADLLRALAESPLAARLSATSPTPGESADPRPQGEPLEVTHEPVGAAEDFAIAPLPGGAAPEFTSEPLASAPPEVPFQLTPVEPARLEGAPPVLRAPDAPPMLQVHVAPATAPPQLRVGSPSDPPVAPPVLRVEPQPAPRPVIVPTPPIAPLVPVAAYAPSATPAATVAEEDVAEHAPPAAPPRIEWPRFEERELEPRVWYRRRPVLAAIVIALFGGGWLLGTLANPRSDEPGPLQRALRAIGLGGPRFEVSVDSSPPGAWIAVDGKDAAKRTPARLELTPGTHELTLSLPDLGAAKVPVKGENGARLAIAPSLHGGLVVTPSDPNVPISVALDGRALGYAPVQVEDLAPGLHELQFSGPGMPPWAQNINVRIGQTAQVLARPMTAPGTGVLQVQATFNDADGVDDLSGAQVYVDGALRGVTPLSLELPRGPHSVKVSHRDEVAAIQVIDLPGGNQRIASFDFGLDSRAPQVNIVGTSRTMSPGGTNMISAAFVGLSPRDLREAWLHVRSAQGLWRRYPMTAVTSPGTTMMAAVFPAGVFDETGRTIWYVSATAVQGDEYFSEMQPALLEGAKSATPKSAAPKGAASSATPAR